MMMKAFVVCMLAAPLVIVWGLSFFCVFAAIREGQYTLSGLCVVATGLAAFGGFSLAEWACR